MEGVGDRGGGRCGCGGGCRATGVSGRDDDAVSKILLALASRRKMQGLEEEVGGGVLVRLGLLRSFCMADREVIRMVGSIPFVSRRGVVVGGGDAALGNGGDRERVVWGMLVGDLVVWSGVRVRSNDISGVDMSQSSFSSMWSTSNVKVSKLVASLAAYRDGDGGSKVSCLG